jgi:hypothetical protein
MADGSHLPPIPPPPYSSTSKTEISRHQDPFFTRRPTIDSKPQSPVRSDRPSYSYSSNSPYSPSLFATTNQPPDNALRGGTILGNGNHYGRREGLEQTRIDGM